VLEIFGYFLLVLIGVELLETLKAYLKKDVIHVRVVLEVALIAMARKVIIEEPNSVPGLALFGIATLILALGIAFYFERQAPKHSGHPGDSGPWLTFIDLRTSSYEGLSVCGDYLEVGTRGLRQFHTL